MSEPGKYTDMLVAIQTSLLGAAVCILVAGVPWAYVMHGRMAVVERAAEDVREIRADMKSMNLNAARLDSHERRIDRLEAKTP